MYQNFVNLTEAIKNKAKKLIYIFNFPITLPDFYNPERGLIDTLRVVVSQAGSAGSDDQSQQKINQVSSKLRSGMNREQFEEEKKGEDLDAIQNVYFDCNALDRIADNDAGAAAASDSNPNEELKMDKDLGLFEMISAGDFSTVSGQPAAAAVRPRAVGLPRTHYRTTPLTPLRTLLKQSLTCACCQLRAMASQAGRGGGAALRLEEPRSARAAAL